MLQKAKSELSDEEIKFLSSDKTPIQKKMTKGQGSTVVQHLFHYVKTQETCITLKDEYRVQIKSFLKSCLLSSFANEEMQFIYTSSHGGRGNTQRLQS